MEKFPSQQAALRQALKQVLGFEPKKYSLVISEEQRAKVGELMMGWLKENLWDIRPGTNAARNPLNYIVGKQPTCLIEAWVQPKQPKNGQSQATFDARTPQQAPSESKFDIIKKALDAGLISKEQAAAEVAKLLG